MTFAFSAAQRDISQHSFLSLFVLVFQSLQNIFLSVKFIIVIHFVIRTNILLT